MKKILLALLPLFSMSLSYGDMKYDPINDRSFSLPLSAEINQYEYENLLLACAFTLTRAYGLDALTGGTDLDIYVRGAIKTGRVVALSKLVNHLNKKYIIDCLKKVGSPTALRLIKDIKKGVTPSSLLDY